MSILVGQKLKMYFLSKINIIDYLKKKTKKIKKKKVFQNNSYGIILTTTSLFFYEAWRE